MCLVTSMAAWAGIKDTCNFCKTITITNDYTGKALKQLAAVLAEDKLAKYVKTNQPMVIWTLQGF